MAIIRKTENKKFIQDTEKLKFSCVAHGKYETVQLLWKGFKVPQKAQYKITLCLCAQLRLNLCDLMDCIAYQAPLSVEFSRQEYWSGLPFLTPGDFPTQG